MSIGVNRCHYTSLEESCHQSWQTKGVHILQLVQCKNQMEELKQETNKRSSAQVGIVCLSKTNPGQVY